MSISSIATVNGFVAAVFVRFILEFNNVALVSLLLSLQMEMTSFDFKLSFNTVTVSDSIGLDASETWNGLVVFVDVTAKGELFKNGFVDDFIGVGLLVSALNSALNIFKDGTLIFSIVPRFSEKWVTVTVSVVVLDGVVTPFNEFVRFSVSCTVSNCNKVGMSDFKPADDGGDGNTFDKGDDKLDWPAFVFFPKFDDPVKFRVNLSPPFLFQFVKRI